MLCFEFFSGIKSLCATRPTSCRFYRPDLRANEQVRASVVIEMRPLISFSQASYRCHFLAFTRRQALSCAMSPLHSQFYADFRCCIITTEARWRVRAWVYPPCSSCHGCLLRSASISNSWADCLGTPLYCRRLRAMCKRFCCICKKTCIH